MIETEFRLMKRGGDFSPLGRWGLTEIPAPGELIDIAGKTYIVHSREWSVGPARKTTDPEASPQFAFVKVTPFQLKDQR